MSPISDVEKRVKEIRRKTRRKYSAEDKIRIVLEGLRGEMTIAELCRRKALSRTSTTSGAETSWRPARSVCPVMLNGGGEFD